MKLSIIVPVYNVETTLEKCVNSISSQGIDDYEILLVDDGSTDGSGLLAEKIQAGDANIKVFHKPNGGLSDARNYGIERSSGDYITFVDSDDYLQQNTYRELLTILDAHPEYDILEYPVLEKPGYSDSRLFNPGTETYQDPLDWLSAYGLEHCWACNKVYKRRLFDTVRFPLGKTYEDIYALSLLIKLNPIIATTGKGLYNYCWNDKGIGASESRNGLTPLLEAQMSLVKTLAIDTREKRWHRLYLNMFTSQLYSYRKTGGIMLRPQRIAINKYSGRKDRVKAVMLNVFGLTLSCKIFKLLSRR